MIDIGKNAWLFDITQTLFRSWWTLVAAICLGLAGASLAIQYLPQKYQATTTVWISRPQLPESVARSTVKEDMTRRLMVFQSAVLDQAYMVELIERTFGLPETEEELRALMTRVRSRVTVANLVSSRRQGFATFALTYRGDRNPQRSANVINTLTQLYISQNAEFRAKRAEKTAETIASMTAAVRPDLDAIDQEIAEFRAAHRFETQADLAQNHVLLESAASELDLMEAKRGMLDARLQSLEIQLTQAELRSYSPAVTDGRSQQITVDPRARQLADLQRELDELRVHYSEVHPTYLKKKRELEKLLSQPRTPAPREEALPSSPGESLDPAVASLRFQVDMTYKEIEAMDGEEKRLKNSIAEFRRRIAVTPAVQRELSELTDRQDSLRDRHRRLQAEADAAVGSADLEEEELLGNRMEVLEFAGVPPAPYSPQPLRIYGAGLVLGCLLFIGPLLARNILNPVILSEEGFRALSEYPVLVSIPNFSHTHSIAVRRLIKNVALSAAASAVLVVTLLFFVP